jgi:(2Fe-2S) ferredoxin
VSVGCAGMCFAEPLVEVATPGLPRVTYQRVSPAMVPHLLEGHLLHGEPPAAWALGSSGDGALPEIPRLADLPLMRLQVRNALRNCGVIDPTSVDHYLARDGYAGLRRAWPRGWWLLHRREVGALPAGAGLPQVRDLQRRRGGSRGVHGPLRARG